MYLAYFLPLLSFLVAHTHTHTHTYIYIYIFIYRLSVIFERVTEEGGKKFQKNIKT